MTGRGGQKLDGHPYSHIIAHMKTTLDLDDKLLTAAKAAALRRRTTLKAMVEHALRRELQPAPEATDTDFMEVGPHGLPLLKRRSGVPPITSEQIYALQDEEGL